MILKILGTIDFVVAGILFASLITSMHYLIIVVVCLYLIIKGLFFILQSFHILSLLDLIIGAIFLVNLVFLLPIVLLAITASGLIIKAFSSFL